MSEAPSSDDHLLLEAVRVLEYATYHDGRYSQVESRKFQEAAIEVSKRICIRLNRKRYADIQG